MPDKISMMHDLDNDATFQLFARVLQVEKKTDSKGDPYHSMKVKDDTGSTWMKAFKSHNLRVRPGDLLRGKVQINLYKGKRSLRGWGDDLTVTEGAGDDAGSGTTSGQGRGGGGAGAASPGVERQGWRDFGECLVTLRDLWAGAAVVVGQGINPEVRSTPQVASAVIDKTGSIVITLMIEAMKGNISPDLGTKKAPDLDDEPAGDPWPPGDEEEGGGGGYDDDDSIPF